MRITKQKPTMKKTSITWITQMSPYVLLINGEGAPTTTAASTDTLHAAGTGCQKAYAPIRRNANTTTHPSATKVDGKDNASMNPVNTSMSREPSDIAWKMSS